MTRMRPVRLFLLWALPGQAAAAAIARLACESAPVLAPAVFLSLGFLALALAVSAAVRPEPRPATGHDAVLGVLLLRRNRGGYALGFALLGVGAGTGAMAAAGLWDVLMPTPGHLLLALALAYLSAWLLIGEAACSQAAIRRALLREVEPT